MAELHHVLNALNAPPYNFDLTAVTLRCEKTWLIQILDTVVSTFSSLHKVGATACMPTCPSETVCYCFP